MQKEIFGYIIKAMEYVTHSSQETMELGKRFAETLTGGEVVLLNGELGAGKTTFTKGVAEGLGISDVITSPTFTLMNEYRGRLVLYHFDMYRLSYGEDQSLGFDEYYGLLDSVCLIEWNVAENFFGAKVYKVDFEYLGDGERRITINEVFDR